MKILVTGGSGFVGTRLIEDLIAKHHSVKNFDLRPSLLHVDRTVIGDVRDKNSIAQACEGIEAVYHLAAEHRDDLRPISRYYETNVHGANNLVHALEQQVDLMDSP